MKFIIRESQYKKLLNEQLLKNVIDKFVRSNKSTIRSSAKSTVSNLSKEVKDLIPKLQYFETAQGSKYIRTPEGQLRRWKSFHRNTQGVDMGMHNWSQHSFFVDPVFEREGNAIFRFLDDQSLLKGRKLAFVKDKEGKLGVLISDPNGWRPLTYDEATPQFVKMNPDKKGKTVSFRYSKEPKKGYHVVDFSTKPNSTVIQSFHFAVLLFMLLCSKPEPPRCGP